MFQSLFIFSFKVVGFLFLASCLANAHKKAPFSDRGRSKISHPVRCNVFLSSGQEVYEGQNFSVSVSFSSSLHFPLSLLIPSGFSGSAVDVTTLCGAISHQNKVWARGKPLSPLLLARVATFQRHRRRLRFVALCLFGSAPQLLSFRSASPRFLGVNSIESQHTFLQTSQQSF